MNSRVELTRGWDAKIYALLQEGTQDTILSAPAGGGSTTPRFPTLVPGSGQRGPSVPFCVTDQDTTTRTVCWCSEMLAGRPETLQRWGAALRPSDGAWASTTKHHRIPTTVLCTALCNPRCFEQEDVGADVHVTRSMELGLSDNASVRERILKFGSTQAADVALHG